MRVIRAQIAASKKAPNICCQSDSETSTRGEKLFFRARRLIGEESRGEGRGGERRKKEGREEEEEMREKRKEEVERPELVGCQPAQCDREGPSALPDTQDSRCNHHNA
ncbi:hypothetical protein EYF80_034225 [Liparis tanakae]|uniref:Uncharacterized protein n=1 Tax=Liparis tanakae TaxID=230148 RepID=A0A4Z2GPT3_9TELE|nr:hypothetical protein EYF80_034225 [Liparis tanakae]